MRKNEMPVTTCIWKNLQKQGEGSVELRLRRCLGIRRLADSLTAKRWLPDSILATPIKMTNLQKGGGRVKAEKIGVK
jgi:hypothetical protein